MALTKKFLRELGVEEAALSAICEEHTSTIARIEKEHQAEADKLAEKVDALEKDLEAAKTNGSEWESKFGELETEFNNYKAAETKKAQNNAKGQAYRELLKEAGITSEKRIDAIMKTTVLDDIEMDDNGSLKDTETLTKNIKEEWEEFIEVIDKKGAPNPNPPGGKGGSGMTKEQIMAIKNARERQEAIANNIELFQ